MITYVIPTRDRHEELARTLAAIAALGPHAAEVLVIDNASAAPVRTWEVLISGVPVRCIRLKRNLAAAARNLAVQYADARSQWFVMLDDDSHPVDLRYLSILREAPPGAAETDGVVSETPVPAQPKPAI